MVKQDWSDVIKEKVKKYSKNQIIFTKSRLIDWLCNRNQSSIDKMKEEIINSNQLIFTEKQEVDYEGEKEERFKCYFIYSGNKGRCYVLKFNHQIKVITAFPLGRTTLKKYRRRFK